MAKLPGVARRDLNGASISTDVVRPTDFGLGALGDAMERFNASEDRIAQENAQRALTGLDTAYNDTYGQLEATRDTTRPGFAKAATDSYDALSAGTRAMLNEREQRFFDQMNDANRAGRVQRAADVENADIGRIVQAQQEAVRASETSKVLTGFNIDIMQQLKDDERGDVMLQPDYEATATARFDQRAQSLIDAAPEWQKPILTQQVAQLRSKVQLDLRGTLMRVNETQIRENSKQVIGNLVNAVRLSPTKDAYQTAMTEGTKAISALPPEQRIQVMASMPTTFLGAMADSYVDNQDAAGLEAFLQSPDFEAAKVMQPEVFARFQGQVATIRASAAQAAAAQALEQDMQDELTRITVTGEGASLSQAQFIKAYGPVEGPVRFKQYGQAATEAKADFGLTKTALTQTSAQYAETIAAMKPADNDPDYARKYARWQKAREAGDRVFAARQADGAGAALSMPDYNAKWQAVQSGQPGAGEQWANGVVALQKQWGHSDAQLSVLPGRAARSIVNAIKKAPPDQKDERLLEAWNTLGGFGRYGGLGLRDLQRARLDGTDAAILNQTQGDPVALGQYAYLTGRAAQIKLNENQTASLKSAVDEAMDDYVGTWAYSPAGQGFGGNLKQAAYQMARGLKADGKGDDEAARDVAKLLIEQRYAISDRLNIRVPRALANQQRVQVKLKGGLFARPAETDGLGAVTLGLQYIKTDLELGRRAFQPRQTSPGLTADQERERERSQIKDRGVWINTEDDTGVMLTVPSATGGFRAVFGEDGKPIVVTWEQAQRHAWEGL
ncbi:hypothetical protein [Asticcacaulis excentricus]|uniref:Uncharacterized protein n=1 Tax=Asticcacaulis excentricus TaxID=78587 RepID=A0A3G9FXU3_9CAUL|nr:hypothetical protein [Asticcacaulis excentricus]BBF79922.1 hypothetical protein EM6_0499 [Asticcacaulis excentricus]